VILPRSPDNAVPEAFTTFCGICGGIHFVERVDAMLDENEPFS
jgi:hypothetical protein